MKAKERELLAANIEFDPPLYEKWERHTRSRQKVKRREIYLHPPSGRKYCFGYIQNEKVYLPHVATLVDLSFIERKQLALSEKTREALRAAILLRVHAPIV